MRKVVFPIILILCLLFSMTAGAYQVSGFEVTAKAAALLSLDTGELLYGKNVDERVYPASLTNLLTAVLMVERTDNLDSEMITMTNDAMNEILGTGCSVIGLKINEQISARQAIACLLIASGGDCVYAVAHHYGGDTDGFMSLLNAKAAEIGMNNSHFGNPVGLHDDSTYTTVSDLIILSKYALKYDVITEITSQSRYTLEATNLSPARRLTTTNMLIDNSTSYYYVYAKGIKTGFTDEAGRCVISTASYNGYNYLCIVMGCRTDGETRYEFVESRSLYRWAFNGFSYKTVVNSTVPICELPVRLSMDTDFVPLYAAKPLTSIFPDDADLSTVKIVPHLNSESVNAPVTAGDVLGQADVIYAEESIGTIDLVAGSSVDSSFILVVYDKIMLFFKSPLFITIVCIVIAAAVLFAAACIALNLKRLRRRKVKYIPYDREKEASAAKRDKK